MKKGWMYGLEIEDIENKDLREADMVILPVP